MKILSKEQIESAGKLIMLYGESGCGKTTSVLQSAPDPIKIIQAEPRSLADQLKAANRPDLKFSAAVHENWEDTMEYMGNLGNFKADSTVFVDSLSHLMNVHLAREIEDEAFEARTREEQKKKPLVGRAKMSMEGYGGLSSQMFRFTNLLNQLAIKGKTVIVTARLDERPKWNRSLQAAPALKGKEYPVNMPGFFDLIGLVQTRLDENEMVVYPPRVFFESEGTFVAKFTGAGERKSGVLNIQKILKL